MNKSTELRDAFQSANVIRCASNLMRVLISLTAPNGLKVKSKFLGIEKYKQVDKKKNSDT